MLRALANTELAGGATMFKVFETHSTGRLQWHLALRHLLLLYHSKTAIEFLLLSTEHRGGTHGSGNCKELAARWVSRITLNTPIIPRNADCILLAMSKAVETHHTTRAVDTLVFEIDTIGFAAMFALVTSDTFLAVNADAKD